MTKKNPTEQGRSSVPKLRLRSSHWIVDENERIVMGPGRAQLLAQVESTGSISQAAKKMKISYKAAWEKIKSTQKHLNIKVVISDRKTGTSLTRAGRDLLDSYNRLNRKCIDADDALFSKIFK